LWVSGLVSRNSLPAGLGLVLLGCLCAVAALFPSASAARGLVDDSIAISPAYVSVFDGQSATFTATITNGDESSVANVPVRFEIYGTDESSLSQ
jgi:outer membrane lipoprotein-sorting protein